MATFSDKDGRKPYLLGIEPHWDLLKPKPLDCAKNLFNDFRNYYKFSPHAVLAARFMDSSFLARVELFSQDNDCGDGVTVVMPAKHQQDLYHLLCRNVTPGQW